MTTTARKSNIPMPESESRNAWAVPWKFVPIVGGMITSTIHVLILVPVFFMLIRRRAVREGVEQTKAETLTVGE